MTKVLSYVRHPNMYEGERSGEGQVKSAMDWCKAHNGVFIGTIFETGKGESISGRPGVVEVLSLAKRKKFDALYCYSRSYIAQKPTVVVQFMEAFHHGGITIITPEYIDDYFDINIPHLKSIAANNERYGVNWW